MPAILGFFEAFIHIAGIKIHNLPRPYSPGMATALLCLLPSAIGIVMFATPGIGAGGWALAVLCFPESIWGRQRSGKGSSLASAFDKQMPAKQTNGNLHYLQIAFLADIALVRSIGNMPRGDYATGARHQLHRAR